MAGGTYDNDLGVWIFDSPVRLTGLTPISPKKLAAIERLVDLEKDSSESTSILENSFRDACPSRSEFGEKSPIWRPKTPVVSHI